MKLPWTKSSSTPPSTGEAIDPQQQILQRIEAKLDQILAGLIASGVRVPVSARTAPPITPRKIRTERDVQFMSRPRRVALQLEEQLATSRTIPQQLSGAPQAPPATSLASPPVLTDTAAAAPTANSPTTDR